MTRVAIMQPYLLPYIGYFQLIAAADTFVLFDDVHYINRGWINRNRMLVNGSAHTFTVPLRGASQNLCICEIAIADQPVWRDKLLRTFQQAYARAPQYATVMPLLERILMFPSQHLAEFLSNSLQEVARALRLRARFVESSRTYQNQHLKGQDRILDICVRERASTYINLPGGAGLYDASQFAQRGLQLRILKPRPLSYAQGRSAHVPWLSIIDVMMFNSVGVVQQALQEPDLQ